MCDPIPSPEILHAEAEAFRAAAGVARVLRESTGEAIGSTLRGMAVLLDDRAGAKVAPPAPVELLGIGDLQAALAAATLSERDRWARCDGSCDIALARRQVGPDGVVPGNAKECAELWEREASRLTRAWRAEVNEIASRLHPLVPGFVGEVVSSVVHAFRKLEGDVVRLTAELVAVRAAAPADVLAHAGGDLARAIELLDTALVASEEA